MPRTGTWVFWVILGVSVVVRPYHTVASPPSETLVPETTIGFFCVSDAKTLAEAWSKTELGQLLTDPVMKPFVEDLRRQFNERWSGPREKMGLSLEELRGLPGGQVAVAAVQVNPGEVAAAFLVNVTGHQAQANALVKKVSANLVKQGAKPQPMEIGGVEVAVFALPPSETASVAAKPSTVLYFIKNDLLVISDSLDTTRGILGRMGGHGKSLADATSFQAVMKRCQGKAGTAVPQIRWYIQPMSYLEVAQAVRRERTRSKGRSIVNALKKQGFGAVQGIGGFVDFNVGKFQVLNRTAVYAPKPYEGAMKSLSFLNAPYFTPPRWVPRDIAVYTTFYANVAVAFDSFGPLFDELYNEGEPGLWEEVLRGLKEDPNGPRIDLRRELVSQLGPRISVLTDYQLPITVTSERLLFAVEVKDEKVVTASLTKLFKNDKEMRRRELAGRVVWESVPAEKPVVPSVSLDLPAINPGGSEAAKPTHDQAILPNQAITVAHGQLFVASHYDFLAKILKGADERESLAKSVEFQMVDKALSAMSPPAKTAASFTRTDEAVRPTYELVREGKMPESETMLGRILNTVFGARKKGVVRRAEIDGSKLPEYDNVRRYLGPAGAEAVSEPTGWFVEGFMMGKK